MNKLAESPPAHRKTTPGLRRLRASPAAETIRAAVLDDQERGREEAAARIAAEKADAIDIPTSSAWPHRTLRTAIQPRRLKAPAIAKRPPAVAPRRIRAAIVRTPSCPNGADGGHVPGARGEGTCSPRRHPADRADLASRHMRQTANASPNSSSSWTRGTRRACEPTPSASSIPGRRLWTATGIARSSPSRRALNRRRRHRRPDSFIDTKDAASGRLRRRALCVQSPRQAPKLKACANDDEGASAATPP